MWPFTKKKQDHTISFLQMELDREKASYGWKQEMEDMKVERDARLVAEDMFQQWLRSYQEGSRNPNIPEKWRGMGMVIQKPVRCILTVYPDQKPKYDSDGYQKLIKTEYKRLKEEFFTHSTLIHGC